MAQTPKESSIVDSILKWLNDLPACKAEKTHGGMYGKGGKPDITGCINGRRFEIEVKRPGEIPTKIQDKEIRDWMRAGAVAFWATSKAEVIEKFTSEGLIQS